MGKHAKHCKLGDAKPTKGQKLPKRRNPKKKKTPKVKVRLSQRKRNMKLCKKIMWHLKVPANMWKKYAWLCHQIVNNDRRKRGRKHRKTRGHI